MSDGSADEVVDRPSIFISHRHADRAVAWQLQRSLQRVLGDAVRVFNSSDERSEGFSAGFQLTAAVKEALLASSLVILLYTRDDADWRWCFYECGVANDPADRVATTTVVFDFGTSFGTKVFEGDIRIPITPGEPVDRATDLRRFVIELGEGTHPAFEGNPYRPATVLDRTTLANEADELHRSLNELGPIAQSELTREYEAALTQVPAEDRRDAFQPIVALSAAALQWSSQQSDDVRTIFRETLDNRVRQELEHIADSRLVFRPGSVHFDWERLLELCGKAATDAENHRRVIDLGRPVLSLVSHESGPLVGPGSSFIEFWRRAQKRGTDASFYERPVHDLARTLHEQFGDRVVPAQRIFVLDRSTFSPEAAQVLAGVATWMAEAHISTAVTFADRRRPEDLEKFGDFGVIGWTAVSRFRVSLSADGKMATDPLTYRSLVEDFGDGQIEAAIRAWHEIRKIYEWSGPGECDADELFDALTRN